jgi:asparagine synthase (glutamine-hydrolysing)
MCGITGIAGIQDKTTAAGKLAAMNAAISHRGPDDEGTFVEEGIALGHRRLSIIDLSAAGHQPMTSYDGRYRIVYNGELYNFRELKFELQRVISGSGQQAYFFQTNTDTEVVIAAYARWGAECLDRFNGMYAFAIWDEQKKELFIARDRLGIKPLYYSYTNNVLAFSSEMRSLLASGLVPKTLDEKGLCDYLRYQTVHAPDTIIKGIKMLMPGHYIRAGKEKVSIHSYWDIRKKAGRQAEGKSYEEVCKELNTLLTKAVERRLVADVPFGAFLSGGIDSSIIVGLMSKVSGEKVRTFSITFDESEFSEAKYAKLIAEKFNTDHHEIRLKPGQFLEQLPEALRAMDHPSGDGINTYVVSKATKEAGITMALSGLGGDELFAGYEIFRRAFDLRRKGWLNAVPGFLKSAGGSLIAAAKPGVASDKIAALLKQPSVNFHSFYPLSRQVLMDGQIKKLLKNSALPANAVSTIIAPFTAEKDKLISAVSMAEISTYMQNVLLSDTDQMSMAHALEVRVPFIDYTLVEYVMGIPDKYKFPSSPKKLLVDAAGDLLPPEIVNRPKMGFTFPWKEWMQNELRSFCEERLLSLSKRSVFDEKEVLLLWKRFLGNDPKVTWSRIWILVVLENWLMENKIES